MSSGWPQIHNRLSLPSAGIDSMSTSAHRASRLFSLSFNPPPLPHRAPGPVLLSVCAMTHTEHLLERQCGHTSPLLKTLWWLSACPWLGMGTDLAWQRVPGRLESPPVCSIPLLQPQKWHSMCHLYLCRMSLSHDMPSALNVRSCPDPHPMSSQSIPAFQPLAWQPLRGQGYTSHVSRMTRRVGREGVQG